MIVELTRNRCLVKLHDGERIPNESLLFYRVKKVLIEQGHDVIKKRPDKDGHLFSAPYYIRQRKGDWCVYDDQYAIRDPARELNKQRELNLSVKGVIKACFP